jgi:hypothetical protein
MPVRKENLYLLHELALPRRTGRLPKEDLQALKIIADWTRDFVAQPHPDLGRGGPVCPFVPPAIDNSPLWFAIEHINHISPVQVAILMNQYKDLFLSLSPKEEEEGRDIAAKKTILVIFPDLPEDKAGDYIDGIQRPLKDEFVRDGLMLGEFHQHSSAPGIHNKDFRPLRSSIPMLVIRHMVITDWRFLYEKTQWIKAWIARFHDGEDFEILLDHLRKLIRIIDETKQNQKEESSAKPS